MSKQTTLPAVHLLRLLRTGKLSSVELVAEHLREIERLNPVLRAYADVRPERALAAARAADALYRTSAARSMPLLGLPVSVKASIEVKGLRCETGSLLYQGLTARNDAVAVQKLKAAGAVILGTTNCPEFLMAYETDNRLSGATANPWDLSRTAGGSSGGESSAIAAGLSAGGLGSDSGGSVRLPAHFTGICALKPTSGRISSVGHTLPCVGPFATLGSIGPMARTIADVALLFKVVGEGSSAASARNGKHLRSRPIAVLEGDIGAPITSETRAALRDAANALRERGFRVEAFSGKRRLALLEKARKLWWIFFMRCGRLLLEPAIAGRETELSATFGYYLETVRREPLLPADELLHAWNEWEDLRRDLIAEMNHYTAILTPACSIPAFRHGERHWLIRGQPVEYFDAMRFTQWFNTLGAPAAIVPVGRSPEGAPIGVQVAGVPFADESVLAVAALIEEAFGYRVPPAATEEPEGTHP